MNSLKWKRRIATFYPLPKNNPRKIILIYHAVGNGPWAISADNFKKQIQWLDQNYKIVPLAQLLESAIHEDDIQVALTFDDGYACLYDTVLPILQAKNAVATVYINTGWMGDKAHKSSNPNLGHYPDEKFLTWDEVKKFSGYGWEIGSHGVDHIDLTKWPENIIYQEVVKSKVIIEDKLSKPCTHFAYTFGKHNRLLRENVKKAGYGYAAAAHHIQFSVKMNKLALPRLNIERDYSLEDFKNIIRGKWDFLGTIHRIKRYVS